MTSTSSELPSAKRLTQATVAAAVVAVAILFAIVLPVEYGIDPLRTGRALGLVRPAAALGEPAVGANGDEVMTPVQAGPVARYGAPYRVDRTTFELGPYEYLEYKYHLAQGASLLYSWEASALVIHDLHGAPDAGRGRDAEVSHDKQNRMRASGSLVAPFAGMHGWYWENPGGTPVTIRLTSAGFYTSAIETRSNRAQRIHEVEPAPLPPVAATR
jgi:hypothetical protein